MVSPSPASSDQPDTHPVSEPEAIANDLDNLSNLSVTVGFPQTQQQQVAEIIYEGFRHILDPLFPSRDQALLLIQACLDPEICLAVYVGDRLVGIAGLQYDNRALLTYRLGNFQQQLGWFKGLFLWLLIRFSNYRPKPSELYLQILAIAPDQRGKGLGTLLLEQVFEFARQNQYTYLDLEVVDTNANARRLYERLGFVAIKTIQFGLASRFVGASKAAILRKQV